MSPGISPPPIFFAFHQAHAMGKGLQRLFNVRSHPNVWIKVSSFSAQRPSPPGDSEVNELVGRILYQFMLELTPLVTTSE